MILCKSIENQFVVICGRNLSGDMMSILSAPVTETFINSKNQKNENSCVGGLYLCRL